MSDFTPEKPLTFPRLAAFYREVMRPEFEQMMEDKIVPLRQEMLQGFDDLYKKFETLQQEMTVTNYHIRCLDEAVFVKGPPKVH